MVACVLCLLNFCLALEIPLNGPNGTVERRNDTTRDDRLFLQLPQVNFNYKSDAFRYIVVYVVRCLLVHRTPHAICLRRRRPDSSAHACCLAVCAEDSFIYPLYIIIYISPAFAIHTFQTNTYRTFFVFVFCFFFQFNLRQTYLELV